MKEKVLLDYLSDLSDGESLIADLKSSRDSNGTTFSLDVESLEEGNFMLVERCHAIKLCNEVIHGNLSYENLNTIAFAIRCSSAFNVNEKDHITTFFFDDWSETSVGYAWTTANIHKWKKLLELEIDTFENSDLKWQGE